MITVFMISVDDDAYVWCHDGFSNDQDDIDLNG